MMLRPQTGGSYQVVGHAFTHGFHDASAFLGPLPPHWRVVAIPDRNGGYMIRFRDLSNAGSDINLEICDVDTIDDPRLGPLPDGWEWNESERTKNHPDIFEEFYHESDKYVLSDPRMTIDALEARGVVLETFDLV